MNVVPAKTNTTTATCPACGLLCDDVVIDNNQQKIKVLANGCAKGITFFEQPLNQDLDKISPKINGKPASSQQAIAHAVTLLKASQQPLFAGLSTDVAGFRSLYHLSQKTNASLQHMNASSMARNMKVLQSTGWQTTTLTEVKNRADVLVCIGSDIVSHNPRFFERFVDVEGMFAGGKISKREVIYLGLEHAPKGARLLPCKADRLPEVLAALRALVLGKTLKAETIAGIKASDLQALTDKLKAAKYAVLAWVAKDLDFPHAELAIQQITQIVAVLNQTTRASGLPLGGSDGDTSANYTHTWLNGVVLDDVLEANIHKGSGDVIIWINSFNAEKLPPKSIAPLIVLGNANTIFAQTPDVFIPVATPGLDCSGTLFRVDGSATLPLRKVRENHLPTLEQVVATLAKDLTL